MAFGLGILALSPRDFWAMTFIEFGAALDGYVRSQGGGKSDTLSTGDARELKDALARAEAEDAGHG